MYIDIVLSSPVRRYKYLVFGMFSLLCWLIIQPPYVAHAETVTVTATVPAPLPTQPAIITSPYNQQHFIVSSITAEGACSNDTAYVEIHRQGIFAGTTACISGNFSIGITLLPGANTLQAKAFSSTGGEGPSAPPITVYYDIPPIPEPIFPNMPNGEIRNVPPGFSQFTRQPLGPLQAVSFFITAKQSYDTRKPGEELSWLITVHGSSAPYKLHVSWGDKKTTLKEFTGTNVEVKHAYAEAGAYFIIVEATDAYSNRAALQLVAVIQGDIGQQTLDTPTSQQPATWLSLTIATATLLTVIVLLVSYQCTRWLRRIIKRMRHK